MEADEIFLWHYAWLTLCRPPAGPTSVAAKPSRGRAHCVTVSSIWENRDSQTCLRLP